MERTSTRRQSSKAVDDAKALFGFSDTTCHNCGISNEEIGGFLLQCAACKKAYYSGMKCFNANLAIHTQFCMTDKLEKEPMGRRSHDSNMTARIGPKDETTAHHPDAPSETTRKKKKKQSASASTMDKKKKKAVKNIIHEASSSEPEDDTESESDSERKPVQRRKQATVKASSRAAQGDSIEDGSTVLCDEIGDANEHKEKGPVCTDEQNNEPMNVVSNQVSDDESGDVRDENSNGNDDDNEGTLVISTTSDLLGQNDGLERVACSDNDDDNLSNEPSEFEPSEFDGELVTERNPVTSRQGTKVDTCSHGTKDDTSDDEYETDKSHFTKNVRDNDKCDDETNARSRGCNWDVRQQQQQQDAQMQRLRSGDATAKSDYATEQDVAKGDENELWQEQHDVDAPSAIAGLSRSNTSNDADVNPSSLTSISLKSTPNSTEYESDGEDTRKWRGGGFVRSLPDDSPQDASKVALRSVVVSKHLAESERPEWANMQLRDVGSLKNNTGMNAAEFEHGVVEDPKIEQIGYRPCNEKNSDMAGLHTMRSSSFSKRPSTSTEAPDACKMTLEDRKVTKTCSLHKENASELNRVSRTGASLLSHSMKDLSRKQRLDSLMLQPAHETKRSSEWTKPDWVNRSLRSTPRGASIKHLGELQDTVDRDNGAGEPDWVMQRRRRLSGIQQSQPIQEQQQVMGEAAANDTSCKTSLGGADAPTYIAKPPMKRHSLLKYTSCRLLDSGSSSAAVPDIVRRAQMMRKANSATNRKQCSDNGKVSESSSMDN